MKNYGIALCGAKIKNYLPGIIKDYGKYNFDLLAQACDRFIDSSVLKPISVEYISDAEESFGAILPSRRIVNIDNYIMSDDKMPDTDLPWIGFREIDGDIQNDSKKTYGVITDIIKDFLPHNIDDNKPILENRPHPKQPPPNDEELYTPWFDFLGIKKEEKKEEVAVVDETPSTWYIHQVKAKDGLWWAVESYPFLSENMPFWIQIERESSPTSKDFETFFLISIGMGSDRHRYDIFISNKSKPRIIQYTGLGEDSTPEQQEFDVDLATIMDTDRYIDISIMIVAGRLIVHINQICLVYNRINKLPDDEEKKDDSEYENEGTMDVCKISPGSIRIYGSNAQCKINVSPMGFAPLAAFVVELPKNESETSKKDQNKLNIVYRGINNKGELRGSIIELPSEEGDEVKKIYGIDCKLFTGDGGNTEPDETAIENYGYRLCGNVYFSKLSKFMTSAAKEKEYDPYAFIMRTTPVEFKSPDGSIFELNTNGGAIFYRVKGIYAPVPQSGSGSEIDITNDIISLTESVSAPDFFHITKNVTITLYNEDGKYDYLRHRSYGVEVGWAGLGKTFTGITISAQSSESAGREIMTVECEDYMYILKSQPIINSPFYDGMVAFYAVKDLAERAGVLNVQNEWFTDVAYFLPAGYAFTKPAMRFPGTQKLFECIQNIVKRFEGFIYFSPDGDLIVKKLPGGLFSEREDGETIVADFTTDPSNTDQRIIFDEKKIEYYVDSTVNCISVVTMERDSRKYIVYGTGAIGDEDLLFFRKTYMVDQPALGSLEVARAWAERLSQRMFSTNRKASFKSVPEKLILPLDFITFCGKEFRVMGINRNFEADSNSCVEEYNVEWLGGE